jgi:8-amino-3,8-dideoxy-alpha-D-manno-octulosonate transaminase
MPGHELIGQEEMAEIEDVFRNGAVLFRQGFEEKRKGCLKVRDFEKEFATYMGVTDALAVSSGTAAIRVALAALGIREGDEVITQCFTFVATVEAIVQSRATPVCTEVDESLNMDSEDLVKCITPKTKAVIVVHMLGTPANLEEIRRICTERKLTLIEDTAWGCGGSYNGKKLGTIGDIGTYSFDYAKTITTGEGGMIVFKDKKLLEKAKAWHDHGHENNPNYPRWEDTRSTSGFNYRMMELQGAIGLAQLKKLNWIIEKQRLNKQMLGSIIFECIDVSPRKVYAGSFETADALVFMMKTREDALCFKKILLSNGISTKILPEAISWHFAGLWDHIEELKISADQDDCKYSKSQRILERCISIPIGVNLDKSVVTGVTMAVKQWGKLNGNP